MLVSERYKNCCPVPGLGRCGWRCFQALQQSVKRFLSSTRTPLGTRANSCRSLDAVRNAKNTFVAFWQRQVAALWPKLAFGFIAFSKHFLHCSALSNQAFIAQSDIAQSDTSVTEILYSVTCNKPDKSQRVGELCEVYYFWLCTKFCLFCLTALSKCNVFFQRMKNSSKFWVFSKVKVFWKFLKRTKYLKAQLS